MGVPYHGEVEIIAVREAPNTAAAAAVGVADLPPVGFVGMGARSAGALRIEHTADNTNLQAFAVVIEGIHSAVTWLRVVDVSRTVVVYCTLLLALAVRPYDALFFPALLVTSPSIAHILVIVLALKVSYM